MKLLRINATTEIDITGKTPEQIEEAKQRVLKACEVKIPATNPRDRLYLMQKNVRSKKRR